MNVKPIHIVMAVVGGVLAALVYKLIDGCSCDEEPEPEAAPVKSTAPKAPMRNNRKNKKKR